MKIHIYYRHTPVTRTTSRGRPSWFSHEICFASLLDSLLASEAPEDIFLTIVFDGTEADFAADFIPGYLARPDVEASPIGKNVRVVRITGGTQRRASSACLSLIKQDCVDRIRDEDDIIYSLENDYLHLPDWVAPVVALAQSNVRWDYLSLYDHGDKYPENCDYIDARRYHHLKSKIVVAGGHHWRTVPSTCGTFLQRRSVFLRDFKFATLCLNDMYHFRILTELMRRVLLTPVPGLSTHSMEQALSPGIDWAKVAKDVAGRFSVEASSVD